MRLLPPALAAAISVALATTVSPVFAITPQAITPQATTPQEVTPGWSPLTPPSDPVLFAAAIPAVLYSVACGDVQATGWSADAADDTGRQVRSVIVTSSAVSDACAARPDALVVRQGDDTFTARPWVHGVPGGFGSVALEEDLPYIDWDFVPTPRVGQWVAISARGPAGEPLPMIERRIVSVGDDTFALDAPVAAEYIGAPVVDNMTRALGAMLSAGSQVVGSPGFCDTLFLCTDSAKVWWDITAPSAPRDMRLVGGKGKVTATWQPAVDGGGAEVAYWYRVGLGRWIYNEKFSVTVRARKGTKVTVSVQTVNAAGLGPMVTKSAKAK